jgi:hypothetical protein
VQRVLARLAAHEHRRAAATAVLRQVVVGQYLEFANGVDVRQNADAAGGELVVVDTVVQPIVGVLAHALRRHRHAAAVRHFAAGALGQEAARPPGHRAGPEQGELHEVAAVQWQLGDLLRVDQLAEVCITALQLRHGRLAGDGDRLGDCRELQCEVESQALLHFEHHFASFLRLEARHRDGDRVTANRQQRQGIPAGDVGDDLADRARAFVPRGEHRSRNTGLRGVHYSARDRSHRLGEGRGRWKRGQGQDQRRDAEPRESHFPLPSEPMTVDHVTKLADCS